MSERILAMTAGECGIGKIGFDGSDIGCEVAGRYDGTGLT
jgi:hypothetical protein